MVHRPRSIRYSAQHREAFSGGTATTPNAATLVPSAIEIVESLVRDLARKSIPVMPAIPECVNYFETPVAGTFVSNG